LIASPGYDTLATSLRRLGTIASAIAAVVLLSACGGTSPTKPGSAATSSPSPKPLPDAATLLTSIKSEGVPIDGLVDYTPENDPNHLLGRPHQYVHKANWHDSRIAASADFDIDGGGSIETFAVEADLASRVAYVSHIAQSASQFAEYEYSSVSGLFFLRLSHYLTPNQANDYVVALQGAFPDIREV
jgi:hypothetical protein